MDPDAALDAIRKEFEFFNHGEEIDIQRIQDCFEGLDAWLCKGGFLPAAWDKDRQHHGRVFPAER